MEMKVAMRPSQPAHDTLSDKPNKQLQMMLSLSSVTWIMLINRQLQKAFIKAWQNFGILKKHQAY